MYNIVYFNFNLFIHSEKKKNRKALNFYCCYGYLTSVRYIYCAPAP